VDSPTGYSDISRFVLEVQVPGTGTDFISGYLSDIWRQKHRIFSATTNPYKSSDIRGSLVQDIGAGNTLI
jgi:hypothetical protein